MCVLGMFVCMSYVCMTVYHVCMYVCSFAFQAELSSCHGDSCWEEGDPLEELALRAGVENIGPESRENVGGIR